MDLFLYIRPTSYVEGDSRAVTSPLHSMQPLGYIFIAMKNKTNTRISKMLEKCDARINKGVKIIIKQEMLQCVTNPPEGPLN